jgi:hypothetical protein
MRGDELMAVMFEDEARSARAFLIVERLGPAAPGVIRRTCEGEPPEPCTLW